MVSAAIGPLRVKVAREKTTGPKTSFVAVHFMFRLLNLMFDYSIDVIKLNKMSALGHAQSELLQCKSSRRTSVQRGVRRELRHGRDALCPCHGSD
jgi:hypothetical protein